MYCKEFDKLLFQAFLNRNLTACYLKFASGIKCMSAREPFLFLTKPPPHWALKQYMCYAAAPPSAPTHRLQFSKTVHCKAKGSVINGGPAHYRGYS